MPQTILQLPTSDQERRRHPRTDVLAPLECMFFEPDGPHVSDELQSLDVSYSGIGAMSTNRYYPGQRVVISLPNIEQDEPRRMHATVVRCSPHREGGYKVGFSFDGASVVTFGERSEAVRLAA